MKYNKEWLINDLKKDQPTEFILFWGHQPIKNGEITKTCLSQWYEISFVVDNVKYLSAEHWMMYEKAKAFNVFELLPEILQAQSPQIAKELGRRIKNFDENVWDKCKFDCVRKGNYFKFSQNEALKFYLLSTGNKVLVEASPYDRIWGIGLGKENPDAVIPEKWLGENLLGFALMEVRDELRNIDET